MEDKKEIKIIKHGINHSINCYRVECEYCGCIFEFDKESILWSERSPYGNSAVKCQNCGSEIVFKKRECLTTTH